jgi:antitoxin (DNA-binding transcriptional repressor) of toxin-antitoxin stability system
MKTLSLHDFETEISSVLLEIEKKGECFVIFRNGEPIADIFPHNRKSRLTPHPVISQMEIHYDPIEPLTHDEWPEED